MGYADRGFLKLPPKGELAWRILRVSLTSDGTSWRLTATQGSRVSIISFPEPLPHETDEAWYKRLDSELNRHARDPTVE